MQKLIHKTIYAAADLNSQIPDVDQMAAFLYSELKINSKSLEKFTFDFLEHLANPQILEKCFYPDVISELDSLLEALEKNNKKVLISSWTQGNVFLQTQKAQIFQSKIKMQYLAKPSIYASLNKLKILPLVSQDLENQGCHLTCIIDDRPENILAASQALSPEKTLFIQKIRPDKPIKTLESQNKNIYLAKQWTEIKNILLDLSVKEIGLVLDKDGVIFNTTLYRQILEKSLLDWLQNMPYNTIAEPC